MYNLQEYILQEAGQEEDEFDFKIREKNINLYYADELLWKCK